MAVSTDKNKSEVYVIGQNRYGELSVNSLENVTKLTKVSVLTDKNINDIYYGGFCAIYVDDQNNYWCSGANHEGQLAVGKNYVIKEAKYIKYFKQNGINIVKPCINIGGYTTFWISKHNKKVYGNGLNNFYQIGINHTNDEYEPVLISSLNNKNIIDIKSSYRYSLALCSPKIDIFIKYYWKTHRNDNILKNNNDCIDIPNGIINLIVLFHGFYTVYSTGNDTTGGAGNGISSNMEWIPIQTFINKKIIKIECGGRYSMFLQSNGALWAAGDSDYGQLGLGHFENNGDMLPKEISYFVDNDIKIIDIKCGTQHCLALDNNHNIYSWGSNKYGQCGQDSLNNINIPKVIDFFNGLKIETIHCGEFHSFVKTMDGKHYLFGSNENNECSIFENDEKEINKPFCIDQIIQKENKTIKSISLGVCNTFFILSTNH